MTVTKVDGQTKTCETIYTVVDDNPTYEGGMEGLMNYSGKNLSQIIKNGQIDSDEPTGKLGMTLTIDSEGNVIGAELFKHKLTEECEQQLRKKLLTMTGWTPGRLTGQNVCCKFTWVISCIKWG